MLRDLNFIELFMLMQFYFFILADFIDLYILSLMKYCSVLIAHSDQVVLTTHLFSFYFQFHSSKQDFSLRG